MLGLTNKVDPIITVAILTTQMRSLEQERDLSRILLQVVVFRKPAFSVQNATQILRVTKALPVIMTRVINRK